MKFVRPGRQVIETGSAATFADIARAMVVPGSLARTQHQSTELALEVIRACDHAEMALLTRPPHLEVVARSSPDVAFGTVLEPLVDGLSVQAMADGICTVDDFATDDRWPPLSAWARTSGVAWMSSIRLASDRQVLGVLNLYGGTPGAYDPESRRRAIVYATHAALAVDGAAVEARLSEAISTRQTIGQAVGILMERHELSAGHAFGLLVKASNFRDVKVRDLARAVVATGADPLRAEIPPELDDDPTDTPGTIDALTGSRCGLRISGAIDASAAAEVRWALDTVSAPGVDIHLELGELDFIAVAAVRPLVQAARTLGGQGSRLVLHEPPAHLTRLLSVLLAGDATLDHALVVIPGAATSPDPYVVGPEPVSHP